VPEGLVCAAHGRHYLVELQNGLSLLNCVPRGKKSDVVCGDKVRYRVSSPDQGVIEEVLPRRNLLRRTSGQRQKLIAANIDLLVLVCATRPPISELLLQRVLLAASAEKIAVLLLLNKCDLIADLPGTRKGLQCAVELGFPLVELCAHDALHPGFAKLRTWLAGKKALLLGQSGVGKSTIINVLCPTALARTRELSNALNSGRHTTTHASLYHVQDVDKAGNDYALIDSPGLHAFGLAHIESEGLAGLFEEFQPHLGKCRFRDCRHEAEPGCELQAALADKLIHPSRLALYHELMLEATERNKY